MSHLLQCTLQYCSAVIRLTFDFSKSQFVIYEILIRFQVSHCIPVTPSLSQNHVLIQKHFTVFIVQFGERYLQFKI